jgi:hypothetical protein
MTSSFTGITVITLIGLEKKLTGTSRRKRTRPHRAYCRPGLILPRRI